jgi:hypothetical protein
LAGAPTNNFLPSVNVMTLPLARLDPSFAWKPSTQAALEVTLLDYVHEVEHIADRIQRRETAITEALQKAPPEMCAVIEALQALQALRAVAQLTAVTVCSRDRFAVAVPQPAAA